MFNSYVSLPEGRKNSQPEIGGPAIVGGVSWGDPNFPNGMTTDPGPYDHQVS